MTQIGMAPATPLRRTSVNEALAAMKKYGVRSAHTERIAPAEAEGRIVAAAIIAPENVPAFARSMVDGYAVIASDVHGASRTRPTRLVLAGEVLMGRGTDLQLRGGDAIAVPTGGALPHGTTGLIKIEDTERDGQSVLVYDATGCEDRSTLPASDVKAGQRLFEAGAILAPAAVALLAACGVFHVPVFCQPAVAVLVTGDELVSTDAALHPGQIRESNGVMLVAALAAMGFAPNMFDTIPDERPAVQRALAAALASSDAVILSGGSSAGAKDYVPAVVAQAGPPGVIVHGVRAKPGRPVLLAMVGDQPVIGLPGNPVSALVMLEALAKPILQRMFGEVEQPLALPAHLDEPLDLDPGLEHRVAVQLLRRGAELRARPLLGLSSQLHILAFADAMIVVPEGSRPLAAGTLVDARPFSRTRAH